MSCIMKDRFTHSDVLKIFPWLKARTIISWAERELIRPVLDASGRGSSRVYSYVNIMEIGIVSELLHYGIPFLLIQATMRHKGIQAILKNKRWNSIIWIDRELFRENLPMDKTASFSSRYGVVPVEEFVRKGGKLIMRSRDVTSAIVININSLKGFIDVRIRQI